MASSNSAAGPALKIKMGPEPVLLSRKEVDILYEILQAVMTALETLGVDYIVTGGSLLGAVRQHSILFCDDDIDIAIIDKEHESGTGAYDLVSKNLQELLGKDFSYSIRPWEGGDRIRSKRMSSVFLDLFTIRRYESMEELIEMIGVKKNGKPQSSEYVAGIVDKIQNSAYSQGELSELCPFWHFDTRKAVEMWAKEVYRESEMFPLSHDLKFGPLTGVKGPRTPVRLLKRAFGLDCFEVYFQSGSHKGVSTLKSSSGEKIESLNVGTCESETQGSDVVLKPLVQAGGTWEGGCKATLLDEHYIPMQPVLKTKRRPTCHDKASLFSYLIEQTKIEEEWELENNQAKLQDKNKSTYQGENVRPRRTVYMDGVFDLFHVGHLEAIRQCAALGDRVIIGVTGDEDAAGYKRPPIISQENRVAVVEALKEVDQVVCPCPLIVTEKVMSDLGIDLVVHGFASDADAARQEEFFSLPMRTGRFQRIGYYDGLSTTDIIRKIQDYGNIDDNSGSENKQEGLDATECKAESCVASNAAQELARKKPQWFGAALAAATDCSADIPTFPFPLALRIVTEPYIRKATTRRQEVLSAVRTATGCDLYDNVLSQFRGDANGCGRSLANEGELYFDKSQYRLRDAFLKLLGKEIDVNLSQLHTYPDSKDNLFANLTRFPQNFQEEYDRFVLEVCAPHIATLYDCDEIYYQAFPCIRVVQPDDFSIGPHADAAYGHHPCSTNYYVPLTEIGGSSALFLESRPGSEDWHPVVGDYGFVKHFSGAMCTHWTAENKTGATRVSLDFRLIPGPMFHALKCGGHLDGGQIDVYRQRPGYYSCCRRTSRNELVLSNDNKCDGGKWEREGPMLVPDERVGFPWTVKNMDKFVARNKQKRMDLSKSNDNSCST